MPHHNATSLKFRIFGNVFELVSDSPIDDRFLRAVLPANAEFVDSGEVCGSFRLLTNSTQGQKGLYFGAELVNGIEDYHLENPEVLDCKIQYALAAALSENTVFLHSGAVAYKGAGIVFPGDSKQGKSTLTKAFLDAGAELLSDDCAVLDRDGKLHPYALPLKIRTEGDPRDRVLMEPRADGFRVAEGPVALRCAIFTGYRKSAVWEPRVVSQGSAAWMMLEKAYYVPSVRLHPERTLGILARSVENALLLEGERSEADVVVDDVIRRLS